MNRLQSEWQRLYAFEASSSQNQSAATPELSDGQGRVRVLVLALARPADWDRLSEVWRGVQADLDLPAPGIAVSGVDGFELWFSLAHSIAIGHAHAFLQAIRERYLHDIGRERLSTIPAPGDASRPPVLQPPAVPAMQTSTGYWSAFVAPNLAPIFADSPWLDSAPSDDGQALVLAQLASISQSAFERACERLGLPIAAVDSLPSAVPPSAREVAPMRSNALTAADPRQFLLQVMNDPDVPLALRIEAAKSLLPFSR